MEQTQASPEETQHFWRWSEKSWQAPDLDWRAASAVTVGIDVGSVSSQAVLLADGRLLSFYSTRTGSSSPDSALRVFRGAGEPVGAHAGRRELLRWARATAG